MVKLTNICFSYRMRNDAKETDEKPVLTGLSLEIEDGEAVAIMGESGSGKTTLIKLLLGLLKPDRGTVEGLEDKRISAVFQEDRLLPWYSAKQNVALVLNESKKTDRDGAALELLSEMELSDSADKRISELSGGMQRRVSIARALAYGAEVLILDEPLKGLDAELKKRVAAKIKARATTIIVVTHDEDEAALFGCKKIVRL